jgi:hypothetical protein
LLTSGATDGQLRKFQAAQKNRDNPIRNLKDAKRPFGAVMSGGKAGSAGKSIKRGRDADSVLSS